MSMFDWFNARRGNLIGSGRIAEATAPGTPATPVAVAPREGVFVSRQSLASFAGASGAVTLLSQVAFRLMPMWRGSDWVPLVAALVVGALVFLINELDPEKAPKNARDWIISVAIAVVNSFVLFNAALGAGSLIS